jgi:hypothetical protein
METENIDEKFMKQLAEEGTTFEEGNTLNDIQSIQKELLHTDWIEEAKQIPLDKVTENERYYLEKCIQQEINENELEILAEILERYRPAIQKHKPQETIENVEKNYEYNKHEKSFLQLLKEQKKEKTLTMNYPLDDGSTYKLQIGIKRASSQAVQELQANYALFTDLTQKEEQVKQKKEQGQTLSREEKIILDNIQRKVNKKILENQDAMMLEFLINHTYILGEPTDKEYLKEIYQNMDPILLEQLFNKVSRLSGFYNPEIEDLFQ